MSKFDSNVKAALLFVSFIRMGWNFFHKPARGVYAIIPLPNETEPFGSLLWMQEKVEIMGSLLRV